MMNKNKRLAYILHQYFMTVKWFGICSEDILSENFVRGYIDHTDAPFEERIIGAPYCQTLARDLKYLFSKNVMTRSRVGVYHGQGFPKWVYRYRMDNESDEWKSAIALYEELTGEVWRG